MRKRELELLLSRIPPHPRPKLELEQYSTPVHLASRLIWVATYTYRDLPASLVFDLGAGTGRLGIGAALVGSEYVVLVDVDREALRLALSASKELGVAHRIDAVCCDVARFRVSRRAECTLQNPPFGVHRRGADMLFLRVALEISEKVYSVHKAETVGYICERLSREGFRVEPLFEEIVRLPPTMPHHSKREHRVRVAVVRASPFSPQSASGPDGHP